MDPITLTELDAARIAGLIETARTLLASYRCAGHVGRLDLHLQAGAPECTTTAVLTINAHPQAVQALLVAKGIGHQCLDYQDAPERAYATYGLTLFGHDLSVVAYLRRDVASPAALTRQAA